jgi:hypothetical protein
MRKWWIRSLALSLGLLATGVQAQEPGWQAEPRSSTRSSVPGPAVTLEKPKALPSTSMAKATPVQTPAVTFGRPVVRMQKPVALGTASTAIQQTSFVQPGTNTQVQIRAQAPDPSGPLQMPAGPAGPGSPGISNWVATTPANSPGALIEPLAPPRLAATAPFANGAGGVVVSSPYQGSPVFPAPPGTCDDFDGAGCCGNIDGNCNCNCYPGNRFYISAEYLLWWVKGSPVPPLLTTSNGADGMLSGALGLPGTTVLYGGNSLLGDPRSGARLMAGYWLDDERLLGFEVGGFFLNTQTTTYSINSGGNPPLYRPLFDTNNGMPGGEAVANTVVPGQGPFTSGGFSSTLKSSFWGAEGNLRSCLLCGQNYFIDGVIGFRTLGLDEGLTIHESPTFSDGSGFQIVDQFKTRNQFYGGQVGIIGEARYDRWIFNASAKIGLGDTDQTVVINGSTLALVPGVGTIASPAGIYAASTNIGSYHRQVFSVVPDLGLSIGYQLTNHVKIFAGYDFIYWTDVLRPGQQIDQTINPTQVPNSPVPATGPARPAFLYQSSDFWAQGIKVGLEFRY